MAGISFKKSYGRRLQVELLLNLLLPAIFGGGGLI